MEFSKLIPTLSNIMFFVWVTWSYVLAGKGMDTNSTVTTAIVTQCIAANLGYFGYQGYLKNSRNIHGIDEKGIPFNKEDN